MAEITKEQIEPVQEVILNGVQEVIEGSGFLNMNIPYDPENPPNPEEFGKQIKTLVAQSIALGIVKYVQEELPEEIPNLMSSIFQNCTVKVTDATGAELTGTIVYTPPAE